MTGQAAKVIGRLGYTDHALIRFGERAGLDARDRATLERLLRELVSAEGRVVGRRPRWARSRNTADAYVQVGDWLLLICRHDIRRPGSLTVVTVVGEGATWERAAERGLVHTPPPVARPRLRERIAAVLRRLRPRRMADVSSGRNTPERRPPHT